MRLHPSDNKRFRFRIYSPGLTLVIFTITYFSFAAAVLLLVTYNRKYEILSSVEDQNQVLKSLGSRIFDAANSNILNAIALHGALPKDPKLSGLSLPQSLSIVSVINADGWLVASTGMFNEPIYLGDRGHFQVHLSGAVGPGQLYVGPPVLGRVSGVVTAQLTRAVRNGDGTLVSVYVASYILRDLVDILNDLPSEDHVSHAIYGADGVLRVGTDNWIENSGQFVSALKEYSCYYFIVCDFVVASTDDDLGVIYNSKIDRLNVFNHAKFHFMTLGVIYLIICSMYLYFRDYVRSEMTRSRLNQVVRSANLSRYVSLGQMAAAFAHEVGTPAQTIRLAIENLRRELALGGGPDAGRTLARIARMESAVERISNLSVALKRFSLNANGRPKCISECVAECIDIVEPILKICKIDITVKGEKDLFVRCVDVELQSIVINLIDNARDSIVNGNKIVRKIEIEWGNYDGFVELMVRDTGGGISTDIMERIFDPLFSTKSDGNGIGLALITSIVNRYSGDVSARNSKDGAIFVVRLPRDVRTNVIAHSAP